MSYSLQVIGPVTEGRFSIIQFVEEGFTNWKFRVEVLLTEHNHGVAYCLTTDSQRKKEFDKDDVNAIVLLVQYVADTKDSLNSKAYLEPIV